MNVGSNLFEHGGKIFSPCFYGKRFCANEFAPTFVVNEYMDLS
jgi:hypothetical protein